MKKEIENDAITRLIDVVPNTDIQVIKDKYKQLNAKQKFIELVAKELNKSALSLSRNWFSAYWSIPQSEQSKVIELLNETLKNQ